MFNSTVASITRSLSKMVRRLEAHATAQREHAGKLEAHAALVEERALAAISEATAADRVREKLTAILN